MALAEDGGQLAGDGGGLSAAEKAGLVAEGWPVAAQRQC
jgi:hypothetical protein